MDDSRDKLRKAFAYLIAIWAQSTPEIKRAWVFGSYAYGRPRPDSDLDVAIEILPRAIDHWGLFTFWMRHGDRLQADLRHQFADIFPRLEVNVELYHRYWGKVAYAAIVHEQIPPAYRRPRSRGLPRTAAATHHP
ncbi:nucleotidyltransferase family protein [Paenacidovorax caeni]|uniref:nucleotidyltransferase family protein n=1 Tax=Paenacidovorax caeni TaxID=343013 RepID=UPI000945783A